MSSENRREIDKAIHTIVGVKHKDCPAAWKAVKRRLAEDEDGFVIELRKAMSGHE
ncbi:MAG: hypothetical protein WCC63_00630 [Candidatus Bathyarchaeia archaeon]